MTLHLLFITVTIQRRKWTVAEIERERMIKQVEEEIMDRKCSIYQRF
ncbi:YrzI family small protein [Anoxybacteroides tepidamans]|nr:YrzI family small protein [Anoxybacillus tepidamans]